MKKKNIIIAAVVAVLAIGSVAGVFLWQKGKMDAEQETNKVTAMYLTYGENQNIFVNTKDGMPFDAELPGGKLYDEKGKVISKEDLTRGNVVDLYSAEAMLESYPGHLTGVKEARVVSVGVPEDADQYNDLIATFYQEADPSERPILQIQTENTKDQTLSAAYAVEGGYHWTYQDAEGKTVSEDVDAPHILNWKEYGEVLVEESQEVQLITSGSAVEMEAERLDAKWLTMDGKYPEAEDVSVKNTDGVYTMNVEPGYLYKVEVKFKQGEIDYGFMTKANQETPAQTEGATEGTMEEVKSKAMYIPYGDHLFVFVDAKNHTPFFAPIPENALTDLSGNTITAADLKAGNIVEITGNGIMMQSYPGQYPGVTAMKVIEEGSPEDVDQYQELISQLYQEPNAADIPSLSLEYKQPDAVVTAAATTGDYEWKYTDASGKIQEMEKDGDHVLKWVDIADITLKEATDIRLSFTVEPQKVEVERWSESARTKVQGGTDEPEDEDIQVNKTEEGYVIPNAEAGYVYQVKAEFPSGEVEYGFLTK